ncbi:uncharacterized protein BKA55DRAFT_538193 [Fusarium redolens]|uniref:Uncharacterized protein n=1 Tax=Fusarium redolens TaxID=48865 RepID=A0A9P9HG40_FUSRE|nr:uncharacterized protein BKA55DRAFT_538193 [Fusarium redolens]KAH7255819.1 hypothetical protein BKA55DRAFT_538193 [Fusarium redolens]
MPGTSWDMIPAYPITRYSKGSGLILAQPRTAASDHETGLSVLDAALMVLSRLRCLNSHALANAQIWFLKEAVDWLLGRGGAQSRHHIRRHAVDGRTKVDETGKTKSSNSFEVCSCWIEAEELPVEVQLKEKWGNILCACQCRGKSERGADVLHPAVPQGRGLLG